MLETFEIVSKAVADPSRIRILKLLEQGELCVCQITTVMNLAPATISKHLSCLKNAGMVQLRREGKWAYYRIAERDLNPYARLFLDLVAASLSDDPAIKEELKLLVLVKAVSVQAICNQGRGALTIPAAAYDEVDGCCKGQ